MEDKKLDDREALTDSPNADTRLSSVPVTDINLSRASSAGADCDRRRVIPVLSLGGSVPVINEMRVATDLFTERGYCTLVKTLLTL